MVADCVLEKIGFIFVRDFRSREEKWVMVRADFRKWGKNEVSIGIISEFRTRFSFVLSVFMLMTTFQLVNPFPRRLNAWFPWGSGFNQFSFLISSFDYGCKENTLEGKEEWPPTFSNFVQEPRENLRRKKWFWPLSGKSGQILLCAVPPDWLFPLGLPCAQCQVGSGLPCV